MRFFAAVWYTIHNNYFIYYGVDVIVHYQKTNLCGKGYHLYGAY